jgi:hypothetical protein
LRAGAQTVPAVAEMIYTDIPAALQRMAQRTVEAHLTKLLDEKRVKREGERYFLKVES